MNARDARQPGLTDDDGQPNHDGHGPNELRQRRVREAVGSGTCGEVVVGMVVGGVGDEAGGAVARRRQRQSQGDQTQPRQRTILRYATTLDSFASCSSLGPYFSSRASATSARRKQRTAQAPGRANAPQGALKLSSGVV